MGKDCFKKKKSVELITLLPLLVTWLTLNWCLKMMCQYWIHSKWEIDWNAQQFVGGKWWASSRRNEREWVCESGDKWMDNRNLQTNDKQQHPTTKLECIIRCAHNLTTISLLFLWNEWTIWTYAWLLFWSYHLYIHWVVG